MKNDINKFFVWGLTLFVITTCGSPEKEKKVKSTANADITNQQLMAAHIYVEITPANLTNIKKGDDLMVVSEDSAKTFTLNVRRVSEAISGITSISTYVDNSETGQAALILRDGMLSGQIDLFDQDIRYRVGYDTTRQAHYLQRVNKDSLDVMEGGEPLVPKREPLEN